MLRSWSLLERTGVGLSGGDKFGKEKYLCAAQIIVINICERRHELYLMMVSAWPRIVAPVQADTIMREIGLIDFTEQTLLYETALAIIPMLIHLGLGTNTTIMLS